MIRAAALALLAAGCAATDPCAGMKGQCIAVTVAGTATGLDQLQFTLDRPSPSTKRTPNPPSPFSLPVHVALVLPAGTTGALNIGVDGLAHNRPIAHDAARVTLSATGKTSVTLHLDAGGAPVDLAGGGGDDLAGVDGGGGPTGDMATGIVFTGVTATSGYELDTINVAVSATDPTGASLTLSATNVPHGATFTPNGDHGTFTWSPTNTDSGSYPVTITATSSTPGRVAKATLPVTVLNTVDAIQPNPPPAGGTYFKGTPIGDFDGDGFADVGFVGSSGNNGSPGVHYVQVVYGDAKGTPAATPYPATRVNAFSYTYDSAVAPTDSSMTVFGGDYNGDGKADLFYVDDHCVVDMQCGSPELDHVAIFVVFGNAARTGTPARARLTTATGGPFVNKDSIRVGDFDGDTRTDLAGVDGSTGTIYLWLGSNSTADNATPITYKLPNTPCTSAGPHGNILGFADLDHNGSDDLVAYDDNVGQTTATCTAPNGGLEIYWAGNTGGLGSSTQGFLHPTGSDVRWGEKGTACDVDHDNFADAVMFEDTGMHRAFVYFGQGAVPPVAAASPLVTTGPVIAPTAGSYFAGYCFKNFYGPSTLVLITQGDIGSGVNGEVDLVIGGSRTPAITRTLANPSGAAGQYPYYVGGTGGDVNGDGKTDILVSGGLLGTNWLFYGR